MLIWVICIFGSSLVILFVLLLEDLIRNTRFHLFSVSLLKKEIKRLSDEKLYWQELTMFYATQLRDHKLSLNPESPNGEGHLIPSVHMNGLLPEDIIKKAMHVI